MSKGVIVEPYPTEVTGLPWWVVAAGHGLLTGTAAVGLLLAGGLPGRGVWLLVLLVAVAAAKQAWEDHTTPAAMAPLEGRERPEVDQRGW